jgi:hypothetical protein
MSMLSRASLRSRSFRSMEACASDSIPPEPIYNEMLIVNAMAKQRLNMQSNQFNVLHLLWSLLDAENQYLL